MVCTDKGRTLSFWSDRDGGRKRNLLSEDDHKARRHSGEDNRKRALRNGDSREPFKLKIGNELIITQKARKGNGKKGLF